MGRRAPAVFAALQALMHPLVASDSQEVPGAGRVDAPHVTGDLATRFDIAVGIRFLATLDTGGMLPVACALLARIDAIALLDRGNGA